MSTRRTSLACILILAVVVAFSNVASAGLIPNAIPGVAATGHQWGDSANEDGSIRTAVDGTGLTVGNVADPTTWTHTSVWQDDWQGWSTPVANGYMVLDLGAVQTQLDSMYVWSVNEGGWSNRAVRDFDLYYATTPTVPPPANSGSSQTYDFGSGGWTLAANVINVERGGTNLSRTVDLSGIPSAQYLGLDIMTDWGAGNRPGFAEVQVTTGPASHAGKVDVFVPNPGFEKLSDGENVSGKITTGMDGTPNAMGWHSGNPGDRGIEGGGRTGNHSYGAANWTFWQTLPDTIAEGDTWTLSYWARQHSGSGSSATASLYWDDAGTRTELAKLDFIMPGSYTEFSFDFAAQAGQPYLGQPIGIELDLGNNWNHYDDIRLSLTPGPEQFRPIPVPNHSFEAGQDSWGFSGGGTTDHDGESHGLNAAWFGANAGAWQGLETAIVDGYDYRLFADTHLTAGSGTELTAALFWYNSGDDLGNPANRHALDSVVLPVVDDFQTVQLFHTASGLPSAALLGVEFLNSGSGYLGVDNVRIAYVPHDAAVVPEPSTFLLAALGLLGLACCGWRRRGR